MLWILVVTFVEDIGPDAIKLFNTSTIDFIDDVVHQEDKVENTLTAQMKEVKAGK